LAELVHQRIGFQAVIEAGERAFTKAQADGKQRLWPAARAAWKATE
jgi:hypothetical protein